MIITAYLLSFLCLILNCSLFIRIKPPYGWFLQMLSHALSPILVVMGVLGAGHSLLDDSWHGPEAVV